MNKIVSALILSVMLLSVASASTVIGGTIYNSDFSEEVPGATVTVTCNGNTQTTTSLEADGAYSVWYPSAQCTVGSSLTVSAVKGDLYGSNSGVIHDTDGVIGFDLGIVNVPLVPEFGLVAGAVTLVSAIGIFFFVRRK